VLRRLLGLDSADDQSDGVIRRVREEVTRAAPGTLLPEREYELPILRYLDEHGGRAPSRDVIKAVGEELADKLTERDRQPLKSGDIRWENRAAFVRLRLVERGDLAKDSSRGTWEISDQGRDRLRGR
jgi:restriction system protein